MTDKMRELQEIYETAIREDAEVSGYDEPSLRTSPCVLDDGAVIYVSPMVQTGWWAFRLGWQASRESLVIELPASPYIPDSEPELMTGYEIGEAQGRCDMWASVRESIESAGLKVKP